jgi:Uma2 family endonuclease
MNEFRRIAVGRASSAGFTVPDFERMMEAGAFDDMRVELVGGVLEKMMPTHMAHGECHANVGAALYAAYRGTGYRLASDLAVEIDSTTVRGPDIAVGNASTPL